MKKRMAFWLGLLFLLSVGLAGCGGGGSGAKSAEMSVSSAPQSAAPPMASNSSGAAMKDSSTSQPPQAGGAPVLDRKIIQNAQVDVRVKDGDAAIGTIKQNVLAAGGYVQETRVEGSKQNGRRFNMTVRVPAGAYGSMVDLIVGLGEQTNLREWTSDVTEEYLDLDARIKTKEAHLAQLRSLLNRGGTINELMEVEREIARVTGELESMKGRINYLSNQVAFSTIVIGLYEPGVPAPIKPPQTIWERMRYGFISSWNGVVNFTAEMAILVVVLIPQLIYLAVLGLIGWGIYRLASKRRRASGSPPPQGPTPPPSQQ